MFDTITKILICSGLVIDCSMRGTAISPRRGGRGVCLFHRQDRLEFPLLVARATLLGLRAVLPVVGVAATHHRLLPVVAHPQEFAQLHPMPSLRPHRSRLPAHPEVIVGRAR